MTAICAGTDDRRIAADAMRLICRELGENAPAYMEGLELLLKRLPAVVRREHRPVEYRRGEFGV